MRAFVVLLRRELTSRRLLLAASLAMGVVVAVVPLFFSRNGARPEEVRAAAAVAVALAWTVLLAIGLGATCLARDLGEHRLAFDFRLPAPATAIWSARLLGAYLTVLLAGTAVLAPSLLAGLDFQGALQGLDLFASRWIRSGDLPTLLSMGLVFPLLFGLALLLLAKNIGGLAIFGDRRWSALDLGSVVLLATGVTVGFGSLYHWGASGAGPSIVRLAATVLLVGLLAATWLQVAGGRTEPDRAHRMASLVLLAAACCAGGAGLLRAQWLVRPDWDRLDLRDAGFQVIGDRVLAVQTEDWRSEKPAFRFLLDPVSGSTTALGPCVGWWRGCEPMASLDGGTIAWLDRPGTWSGSRPARLMRLSSAELRGLGESASIRPAPTRIVWSRLPAFWGLSPDGTLVASRLWDPRSGITTVVLESLDSGRVRLSVRVPDCTQPGWIFFSDPQRVVLNCQNPPRQEMQKAWIVERIDLGAGADHAPETVRLTGSAFRHRYGAVSGGDAGNPVTLLPRETVLGGAGAGSVDGASDGWTVAELRSGEIAAHLEIPSGFTPEDAPSSGVFFSDRRFAGAVGSEGNWELAVWDPAGQLQREIRFPEAGILRVFGPADDQRSVLATWAPRQPQRDVAPSSRAARVDVATGKLEQLAGGLRIFSWFAARGRSVVVSSDRGDRPLWFDPATASLRPISGEARTPDSTVLGR